MTNTQLSSSAQTYNHFSLEDNGKINFYFKDGMMWERTHDSGDNLWRTSLAYIAYGHPALKEGMMNCTRWIDKNHIRFYRSVEQTDENVSRDQITMFLVALALRGEDVKKYTKAIKWKLSKRYSLTPDMWLWLKALGGNKIARTLFYLIEIPIVKVYQLWNKSNISKNKFPAYAVHLLAWQIYALENNSNMKQTIGSAVVKMADKENYLIRLLCCHKVSKEEIEQVKPHTDFIWQRYRDDFYLRELTEEEAEFNTLDVDVLKAIYYETY